MVITLPMVVTPTYWLLNLWAKRQVLSVDEEGVNTYNIGIFTQMEFREQQVMQPEQ